MRLQATRTSVTSTGGAGDALYRAAGSRPTLDQRFAKDKSLVDKVSGQNLITFTRASSATYVGSDGLIKTAVTDAPRFDHDPVTGESLGLLIEESRANLLTYSEQFDQWTQNRTTVSLNSSVSPSGQLNANKLNVTTDTGYHAVNRVVTGGTYVASVFAKSGEYDGIQLTGTNSIQDHACFNLTNGTAYHQGSNVTSINIENVGNGWYRCSARIPITNGNLFITITDGITTSWLPSFAGSSASDGIYIWGAQLEEGSFPTSYIPTTTSAVTRSPDIATIEGTNFSSWYNQSEGTFFADFNCIPVDGVASARIIGTDQVATPLYWSGFVINSYGLNQGPFVAATPGTPHKGALSYSTTSPGDTLAVDGTSASTVGGYNTNTVVNALYLFSVVYASNSTGHISRLAYFPTKRTDQELINVTGGDTAIPVITYGITSAGGTFNLRSTGTVDYAVDWDSTGGYESSTSNTLAHTYTAGNYDLVVYSDGVYRPYFNNVTADVTQITSVVIGSGANLGTALTNAWYGATNMTSFVCPFDVTSGVTAFSNAWRNCTSLTSFPLIDTSSGTIFSNAWRGCNSLTSFPLIDTSSGTAFINAWRECNSLTSFPANMFDTTGTLVANAFGGAWLNCALTAQSIENILVSLDTNGTTGITLAINDGTNAAKTTWSAAAVTAYDNLIVKGWTITFNA